jgi:hypothetical protein
MGIAQADLVDALAGLTARGVLLMGVEARCPSCGVSVHPLKQIKRQGA